LAKEQKMNLELDEHVASAALDAELDSPRPVSFGIDDIKTVYVKPHVIILLLLMFKIEHTEELASEVMTDRQLFLVTNCRCRSLSEKSGKH
jgi:hypothetical protein